MLPIKLIKQWKPPSQTAIFDFLVRRMPTVLFPNSWSKVILGRIMLFRFIALRRHCPIDASLKLESIKDLVINV